MHMPPLSAQIAEWYVLKDLCDTFYEPQVFGYVRNWRGTHVRRWRRCVAP